jgi:Winged helix DNA-binding domain
MSSVRSSRSSVLAERLCAQLLSGPPAGTVVDVVRRLLAVQAQDPRGARLAIRARSVGLSARDVDRALTVERSLVVSTLNRGTLHLVRSDDYWWLHPLTTPQLATANRRQLHQEQISADEADRGISVIERALSTNGPQTRAQLRAPLQAAGLRAQGRSLPQLLLLATLRGLLVRGPMVGREQAFVLVRDWLGTPPRALPRDLALGELARRYLAGHGPAGERDLMKWAGITAGDARRGLRAISSQLVDRSDGLAAITDRSGRAELPPPRLLGAFDPSLLGWESRDPIVAGHASIVTTNGLFRPFVMVKGRAAATWSLRDGTVTVSPLPAPSRAVSSALDAEAAAVLAFVA